MGRARRIAIGVAALAGLQLGAWWLYQRIEDQRPSAAPRFELEPASAAALGLAVELARADGTSLRLEQLTGKSVVIHFWATWCVPCRDELPTLLQLEQSLEGDPAFVLVSVDEGWAPIRQFFGGDVPSSVVLDESAALRTAYNVGPLPQTLLIDRDGQLRARVTGARDWGSPGVREKLLDLSGAQ